MKTWIPASLIFVAAGVAPAAATEKSAAKTPVVISATGAASMMTARETSWRKALSGVRLVEHAELKTGAASEIRLQLDPDRVLVLMPSTEIELPGIRWEGGECPVVILKRGRLRWTSKESSGTVSLKTGLFELSPGQGDFVFSYAPDSPRAEVWAFAGTVDFKASNAETSVKVSQGQKAWFQGVIEDGEIAADILLHGKRIPRGKLSEAEAMTGVEMAPYRDEEKKRKAAETKRAKQAQKQKVEDAREGVICSAPKGKLNQCAWVCQGNPADSERCHLERAGVRCVRKRCNANGAWAESTVLEGSAASRCRRNPVVAACDY